MHAGVINGFLWPSFHLVTYNLAPDRLEGQLDLASNAYGELFTRR
jgi:hypothetical protein